MTASGLSFSFEVRETDLLGRIGTLRVGGKSLETPCLLPVVHPVDQAVPTAELRAMGFGGVMTNSYILASRRRAQALKEGVHRLIGYDGVVMTDSGGYQALEYGDLGLGYDDAASFEADIGADLAVTLDRPTGYPQTRAQALETVRYSLRNAKATLAEFGDRSTVWVGPVQGGLHLDLVRRSARAMVRAGFGFLALGSPVQVMESYMYADLARMILAARGAAPYSVPLHLFGAGHTLTMALAVSLGCDFFDSASYILFAREGRYMTRSGTTRLGGMKYLPCSCGVCAGTTAKGLLELEQKERTRRLAVHNLYTLRQEMEACKEAIAEGRLWDLVEERSVAHPKLREAFYELAKHTEVLSPGTPQLKERGLFVRGPEDLGRPELASAAKRLARAGRRGSDRAVVLAEEAGPETVARYVKGGGSDVYGVHPVLGAYPAELGFVYPFSQSVVSATLPPRTAREGARALRGMGYSSVSVVRKK
jgi:7-cyano-7-deazaguanine tRNA-ribosyltransferase